MKRRNAAAAAVIAGLAVFALGYPTSCSSQEDGSSRAVCSTPVGIEHTVDGPDAEADDAQMRAIAMGAAGGVVVAAGAYALLRRRRE